MDRHRVLSLIRQTGIVAIVRGVKLEDLAGLVEALKSSGIKAIEITMNTPAALEMLERLSSRAGADVAIGAGTVLDSESARSAILAGARFLVTPSLNATMIETCHRYGVPVIPGAFTPTEVLAAWELGAALVKVFPAGRLGPGYIRDLRGPFPQVEMMAVGGVTLGNAADFIRAGCSALGVGSDLVDRQLVAERRFDLLAQRAAGFLDAVRQGMGDAH